MGGPGEAVSAVFSVPVNKAVLSTVALSKLAQEIRFSTEGDGVDRDSPGTVENIYFFQKGMKISVVVQNAL